ncbi:putative F-box domain, FBD domain, leucine-rich repeat domain, L domain-containing protein [Medicago truncatula]|uniref:Putative F-box domain, FBD domain, leucine-rich repeat domain, L domain-containing protein n=1 Tax=Medicago truncatula TaxID=3880 RepID=G7IB78_MEDTR|nr:F-box/FBD/LRR-repeat protein At1g13570 isoform X2 [Medicago truncatula]AES59262.2 ubiquitin-protein ligase, putative [Medicago truncatula]RHN77141.1 putative F-box domain, FBD domain, leucine-rich repeat domain, L domain-containing protein [Medicago truncatula]
MARKRTKSTLDAEPDRISWLPGHVIDQIMSYLPIRDAVRTSVLSRNWRKKWYTLPNLVFDTKLVPVPAATSGDPLAIIDNKFLQIVDHVLLVHSGPINMFKFSNVDDLMGEDSLVTNIDRWILHLIGRSIKELVLEVWIDDYYKLPWCLFSCQSLHSLKLNGCLLKPPTMFEGFRNLKSLDLCLVNIVQDAFENFISRCPLLEKLRLREFYGLTQINIHAPNLKFFEIVGEFEVVTFGNTFQLTTIVIYSCLELTSNSNQSRSPGCSSNLLKFFDHRPHIQSLEIDGFFLKYLAAGVLPVKLPTPCINLSFLSLTINFDNMEEISAALCVFRSSPNLQKLKISALRAHVATVPLTPATYCWEDISSRLVMPFRVRHVTIDGISGTQSELNLIRFLLLYSLVLEKMIVKPVANVIPELMKALIRFKRASGEVEVIWKDPS